MLTYKVIIRLKSGLLAAFYIDHVLIKKSSTKTVEDFLEDITNFINENDCPLGTWTFTDETKRMIKYLYRSANKNI